MEISIEGRDLPARLAKLRERLFHQKDHARIAFASTCSSNAAIQNSFRSTSEPGCTGIRFLALAESQENLNIRQKGSMSYVRASGITHKIEEGHRSTFMNGILIECVCSVLLSEHRKILKSKL